MSNFKEKPRYNVVSIRLTDEEKAALKELTRITRKSVSRHVREAILMYIPRAGQLADQ